MTLMPLLFLLSFCRRCYADIAISLSMLAAIFRHFHDILFQMISMIIFSPLRQMPPIISATLPADCHAIAIQSADFIDYCFRH